jgi:hypothetical protein
MVTFADEVTTKLLEIPEIAVLLPSRTPTVMADAAATPGWVKEKDVELTVEPLGSVVQAPVWLSWYWRVGVLL